MHEFGHHFKIVIDWSFQMSYYWMCYHVVSVKEKPIDLI